METRLLIRGDKSTEYSSSLMQLQEELCYSGFFVSAMVRNHVRHWLRDIIIWKHSWTLNSPTTH